MGGDLLGEEADHFISSGRISRQDQMAHEQTAPSDGVRIYRQISYLTVHL
jgi:hypothetical protein